MKSVVLAAILALIFTIAFCSAEIPAEEEGTPAEGTLYRQARGICFIFDCQQTCFPKFGTCLANKCHCYK